MSGTEQKRELSVASAARRLGISDSATRQAITAGRLRARKDGGTWYVDAASVESFVVSNRGPKPREPRRPVIHEIDVQGLTREEVQELDAIAARMRAAKGARAA